MEAYNLYFTLINEPTDYVRKENYYNLGKTVKSKINTINELNDYLHLSDPIKSEYFVEIVAGYGDANLIDVSDLIKELAGMYAIIEFQRNIHNPYFNHVNKNINKAWYSGYNKTYLHATVISKKRLYKKYN